MMMKEDWRVKSVGVERCTVLVGVTHVENKVGYIFNNNVDDVGAK